MLSFLTFLTPVFQGILTSVLFESGKSAISFLTNNASIEKRYRNAFEKAVCRYFAEPEYASRVIRSDYPKYLESLRKDLKEVDDLRLENGVYKQLSEYFKEEVCKDVRLWMWTVFRMIVTSDEKLDQLQAEQHKVLDGLNEARKEQLSGFSDINAKLGTILQTLSSSVPDLRNIAVSSMQCPVAPDADLKAMHIASRAELVDRCAAACEEGKVLILYGSVKIGKSTLAELIRRKLRDVVVHRDVAAADLENVIRYSCLEKNPSISSIITTQTPLNTNFSLVDTSRIVQVEVPLLNDEEMRELIDTYSPSKDYTRFIKAHTSGHPVLVKTLCSYLSSCNWVIDEGMFAKMLNYSFDSQLSRSLAELLKRIIPDPDARTLLNRMMLVKGPFTDEDVIALAEVEPEVREPRTLLLTLQPNWVTENAGTYNITPLYDKAWTPDMNSECYKACNRMLASRILSRNLPLTERDVLHYMIYAQNSEDYDAAGYMYFRALGKVNKDDVSKLTIFPSVWIDVPLPDNMDIHLRIVIRIRQLIVFDNLSDAHRNYILKDLCQMVESMPESELTSEYYAMLCTMCLYENNTQAGLKYYDLSRAKRGETTGQAEGLDEIADLFEKSFWYFPLRFTDVAEYNHWFDAFSSQSGGYDHSDPTICEHCFLAAYHLVYNLWKDVDKDEVINGLYRLTDKALSYNCPEIAVAMLYEIMEAYNKTGHYSDARKVYEVQYGRLKEYPLAIVLLNGSMAYSIYSDSECDNQEALPYIHLMKSSGFDDIIPNVHMHMLQIEAYVKCEADLNEGIRCMKAAVLYLQQPGHSVTPFDYYKCLGEMSFMYWRSGKRTKASEILSECVAYVLFKAGMDSEFAKTYLCTCDCLLMYYLSEIKGQPLPAGQAIPYFGMFTEKDANSLDDLYTVDRIYTSTYMMYEICNLLALDKLRVEWAYKVLDTIQERGENVSIHFVSMLLVPIFAREHDYDAIARISDIYSSSLSVTYKLHQELRRENVDTEYVQYVIVPALLSALERAVSGDRSELQRVKAILKSYKAVISDDVVSEVSAVFDREEYDMHYIKGLRSLDMNRYYPVYVCAYLMTALSVDAFEAFKLIMALIVRLEEDLVSILGIEVKSLIRKYIFAFWRARILTSPEQFVNHELLLNKGMKKIDEYVHESNGANRMMYVVSNHLPQEISLVRQQEDWLYMS